MTACIYTRVGTIYRNEAGQISISGMGKPFDISKYVGEGLYIKTGVTVDPEKLKEATRRAVISYEGVWPKTLTSGVMFYCGYKITYEMFMEIARR